MIRVPGASRLFKVWALYIVLGVIGSLAVFAFSPKHVVGRLCTRLSVPQWL